MIFFAFRNFLSALSLEKANYSSGFLSVFGIVRLFSENFECLEGFPSFFDFFATEWMLKKPKGPLTFFGTMRLFKILVLRKFLYVSKQKATERMLENPKGSPFLIL